MIRGIFLLINIFVAFVVSAQIKQDIKVNMDVPDKVNAGESFQITLTIDKGNIQSFSRFQQDLPYGLTAERNISSNADFLFENQRVRFIWLKLPVDEKINVVYTVYPEERLKGSFNLGGEFSFIEQNESKALNVGTKLITIVPSHTIPDSQQVDIKDYHQVIIDRIEAQKSAIPLQVIRKPPRQVSTREIIIEIKIIKGNLTRLAKIEEYIPEGFTAIEGESNNGIFSYENNTVKILWMNLPKEPDFTISYKLSPEKAKSSGSIKISGLFSYILGNQTKSIDIIEKDYDIAELKSNESNEGDEISINQSAVTDTTQKKAEEKLTVEISVPVEVNQVKQLKQVIPAKSKIGNIDLQPENGVYYRVQIGAGHYKFDIRRHFRVFRLDREIKVEFHEGWRKYTIGSFISYQEALEYRNKISKNNRIKDAFVCAYNNGKRITVREALKISNQKSLP